MDYHYTLKIYSASIGADKFITIEWKTCDGTTYDLRNRQNYLMYSKEFDYMDSGKRDTDWNRIAK
ncbi:glycosyltransferase family 2 protein [Prevotella sp. MGM1]|nr:glycosyltransferase family 2 protein [Prevotella sp. MGM1]